MEAETDFSDIKVSESVIERDFNSYFGIHSGVS